MADIPVIDLDPYLAGVQATLQLLQQLGLIPDLNPLDYIISAFDGKPKLEDTELAALRLQSSPWWPLQALGNNLQIWVRNGVPLSTGIAADRQQLSQWIQGTIDSLEPIVFNRFDPYALDHAIWLAMTSQFGDQAIRQLNDEIANQHAKGPLPTPPPQPSGPPPVPSGVGVHLSRDGDELADYGDTLVFQNSLIYDQLQLMGAYLTKLANSDCCSQLKGVLGVAAQELTAIALAISQCGKGSGSVDLSGVIAAIDGIVGPIVRELEVLKGALTGGAGGTTVDLQPLIAELKAVGAVLQNIELCVCDWTKKDRAAADADRALQKAAVTYWAGLGLGDPNVNQLVESAP